MPLHGAVFPEPVGVRTWAVCIASHRSNAGKTDLATVGMSREIKMDAGSGGLFENFGCMRQQDTEAVGWDRGQSAWQVVTAEIEGVIDPQQPEWHAIGADFHRLVDEHTHAHFFEFQRNLRTIVVPQDTVNAETRMDIRNDLAHERVERLARPVIFKPVVAGQEADIWAQIAQERSQSFSQGRGCVDVEVGEVQDLKTIQFARQAGKRDLNIAEYRSESISQSPPIQACSLEAGFEKRPGDPMFELAVKPSVAIGMAELGEMIFNGDSWLQRLLK